MTKLREPLIVDSVSPLDEKVNVGAFTITFRGLLYLLSTLILAYTFYTKHTPAGYAAALATFAVGLTLIFYPPRSQSLETIIILAAAYLAGNTLKTGGNRHTTANNNNSGDNAAAGAAERRVKPKPKAKPGVGVGVRVKPAGGGGRPRPTAEDRGRIHPQQPQRGARRQPPQHTTQTQHTPPAPSTPKPAGSGEGPRTPTAKTGVGAHMEKADAGLGEPPADPAYAKRVESYVYAEMSTYTASMLRGLASQLFRTQRYREYTSHEPLLEALQAYITPLAGLPHAAPEGAPGGEREEGGEGVSQR